MAHHICLEGEGLDGSISNKLSALNFINTTDSVIT